MTKQFGRPLRGEWLLQEDTAFLNHGSFGATPRLVLQAQARWQERLERQPVLFLGRELAGELRRAAAVLADFVGAEPENLVFIDNATSAINSVLRSQQFAPGDRLVTTGHVYNAVRQALCYVVSSSGAELVEVNVPFPSAGEDEIVARFEEALGPSTRLAVIDHVTSATALIFPVERLVTLCRERGIPVLVDGAHAPGMVELHLESLGADWYTGNCHKWLCAPKGCAFLWTHPRHQATTHPLTISHDYEGGYRQEFEWTGTRDPSAWLAVVEAIDFHRRLGPERVRSHNHTLALAAAKMLVERWGGALPAPEAMLGSMVTLPLPPLAERMGSCAALHDTLWDEHRIEVPIFLFGGSAWVRISAQVYNEFAEYERLAEAVLAYLPVAGAR